MKDAYILVTMDCNNDCMFCSIPKKDIYLSYEDIKSKIDKYKTLGYNQITLTGGEPTLHKDILKIISYVKSLRMDVRMVTNGTMIDYRLIDNLILAGLDYITFSVHTLDKDKAKIISVNDKYDLDKILSVIKYSVEHKLRTYFNYTINGINYKELPAVADYIVSDLKNIHLVNFNFVDLWGNVKKNDNEIKMSVRYFLSEYYFTKAFNTLKKNGILFRAERIPMCYLIGFEESSSDFNRIISSEEPKTDFIDQKSVEITGKDYKKSKPCKVCRYQEFCFGLSNHYADKYGFSELYPIFHNIPDVLIKKIKKP